MAGGLRYAIRVKGHLDRRWADWFGQVTIVNHENGDATLHVVIPDTAALHGLLARIRDMNLHLLSLSLED
ncbi:MAG TPA: hypothetical protein VD969_24145 [Symbiobacteriaceae bacterium]|nr:hypothetical protein [Symbiobacteriaceae bacterium]